MFVSLFMFVLRVGVLSWWQLLVTEYNVLLKNTNGHLWSRTQIENLENIRQINPYLRRIIAPSYSAFMLICQHKCYFRFISDNSQNTGDLKMMIMSIIFRHYADILHLTLILPQFIQLSKVLIFQIGDEIVFIEAIVLITCNCFNCTYPFYVSIRKFYMAHNMASSDAEPYGFLLFLRILLKGNKINFIVNGKNNQRKYFEQCFQYQCADSSDSWAWTGCRW